MNDNDQSNSHRLWAGPDPHGQAAPLLAEDAAEVKVEIAPDLGDTPEMPGKSLQLLSAIASSLRHDTYRR